jgi:neutral ceramidase
MRPVRAPHALPALALLAASLSGCGGCDSPSATPDAGAPDASHQVTTDLCDYVPMEATAGAGGDVTAGALSAGAAEAVLHVPVGTAMGGYTARAGFGGNAGKVDGREVELPGSFNASVGVGNAPKVKAVALAAGGETVVLMKLDVVFIYEGLLFDLEQRLGEDFHGKVLLAASHSHSGWAQFTGHDALKLGSSQLSDLVYGRFLDALEQTALAAIADLAPAKLGIAVDDDFDPDDLVTHDRRGDNDDLMGGPRKDDQLVMIRVDDLADQTIALIPIYGVHGTINGADNPIASADASGAIERLLEEQYDHEVVVMHLNSAGGDVSPAVTGGVDCAVPPGNPDDPCFEWTSEELHGRAALPLLQAAVSAAGAAMQTSLPLEMLSRSIELGPDPETFTIREGAGQLSYAPFDGTTAPDLQITDGDGALISPIDEFNAPVGAALCESGEPLFPGAIIVGTEGTAPYGSCLRLDLAADILGPIFDIDFGVEATEPLCETTRTTISALRLGDYILGTLPGEATVMIKDLLRAGSPVAADHTIVVGYAQGHVGYMLRPEDWVRGGYESSVTFWGPLEAEHIVEEATALLPLATTDEREDGTLGGTTRVAVASEPDDLIIDDPAPGAGTVPSEVPADTWLRSGLPAQAQPAATVERVSGLATFVWLGDDPLVQTPSIRLEREIAPGTFAPVVRRSGRQVTDQELILTYTPTPLRREDGEAQTHVWAIEWQAVPWIGADEAALADRGGVPLGTYRFHVEGDGWTLDSDGFEVVPGGLEASDVDVVGTAVSARASYHAPRGWRALATNEPSNRPVPLRSQQVTVRCYAGAALLDTFTVSTDGAGLVTVDPGAASTRVEVEDRFGNVASANL